MKNEHHSKIFEIFYKKNKLYNIIITPPLGIIGSLSLLEKTIICAFIKNRNCKKIFEFGTFLGSTTAMMALNSKKNCKIFSIDLPHSKNKRLKFSYSRFNKIKKIFNTSNQNENDNCLKKVYDTFGSFYISKLKKKFKKKIQLLKNDSTKFNFTKFKNYFDIVFIDGGHNIEILKQDTRNALYITKKNGIIIWHDVGSKIHTDVNKYLITLKKKIIHIDNTLLAYTVK